MTTTRKAPTVGIIGFGRFGPVLVRMLSPAHEVVVYDMADVTDQARSAGVRDFNSAICWATWASYGLTDIS